MPSLAFLDDTRFARRFVERNEVIDDIKDVITLIDRGTGFGSVHSPQNLFRLFKWLKWLQSDVVTFQILHDQERVWVLFTESIAMQRERLGKEPFCLGVARYSPPRPPSMYMETTASGRRSP